MNKAVTLRELLSDRFNTGLTNLKVLKNTRDVEGAKSLSSIYTYSQQRIVLNGREVQSLFKGSFLCLMAMATLTRRLMM